ncbi:MAG: transglutaminase family protein [Acidimicrobiales bacterium]|jgi:transglutaminase-like putative cysteine protease
MSDSPRSAQLQIRHVTGFNYEGHAESSYNEARMTPPGSSHQEVLDAALYVSPHAVQSSYRDYFGTIVTTFDLHEPHEQLEVVALATVKTHEAAPIKDHLTMENLKVSRAQDDYAEYLAASSRTTVSSSVLEELRALNLPLDNVSHVARDVVAWVQDRVAYVRGSTLVSSTAQEVWEQKKGVCQDLTHVTIALLRGLGVPARYVSGYLHSNPDAQIGETIIGESHAWVEYFSGSWVGIDATNASSIGTNHVIVAKGRDYSDVPPLKGIYHGGPSSALGVVVEVTRVG